MKEPYLVMIKVKGKVESMISGTFCNNTGNPQPFTLDELKVIYGSLEYGTKEWWEDLKDKE